MVLGSLPHAKQPEAPSNIPSIVVTPEVSHAPMSSLKDDASLNNSDMSVTPDVSHFEMWPYATTAAALSENQRATAVLIVLSSATRGVTVGAGVDSQLPLAVTNWPCTTPHDVDAHLVPSNASWKVSPSPSESKSTSSSTHQPRSWSKFEAPLNISLMSMTL